jgi:hypothetical protein
LGYRNLQVVDPAYVLFSLNKFEEKKATFCGLFDFTQTTADLTTLLKNDYEFAGFKFQYSGSPAENTCGVPTYPEGQTYSIDSN